MYLCTCAFLMKEDLDLNAKPCELFKKVFHQFIWTKIFVFNNLNVIMNSPICAGV